MSQIPKVEKSEFLVTEEELDAFDDLQILVAEEKDKYEQKKMDMRL